MTKPARAPSHLGDAGRALWRGIAALWAADGLTPDARDLRLLLTAAEQTDIAASLQKRVAAALDAGELFVRGSAGQQVANPLIGELRATQALIRTSLLSLDLSDPDARPAAGRGAGSGSRTTSFQARSAAFTRHYGRAGAGS